MSSSMIVSLLLVWCLFEPALAGRKDYSILASLGNHLEKEDSEPRGTKPEDKPGQTTKPTPPTEGQSQTPPQSNAPKIDCPGGRKATNGDCYQSCPANTVSDKADA